MTISTWKSVLDSLTLVGQPLKTVSEHSLDRFELATGFKLPQSYREFCMQIGPGILVSPHEYEITAPSAENTSVLSDLISFNQFARDCNSEYIHYCKDVSQFNRAWFFGTDIGTSWYFWDPLDVTNAINHEYGIYIMYRDWDVERLSNSFWEFINDICLGSGVPGYDNSLPIERTFEPK